MQVYVTYAANYPLALTTLTQLRKKSTRINDIVVNAETNPAFERRRIIDYLIMPNQRIPRYELLLDRILKHTALDHPDRPSLEKSLEQVKNLMKLIDSRIH